MLKKKLNRRRFLQAGGAGLTGLTLLRNLPAGINAQTTGTSERRIYSMNHGWLYSDKVVPNATQSAFNDAGFRRVTIPHTNKLLPWHGFDDKEYEFVSIYRRIPQALQSFLLAIIQSLFASFRRMRNW
jgi:beta-galactosidase